MTLPIKGFQYYVSERFSAFSVMAIKKRILGNIFLNQSSDQ